YISPCVYLNDRHEVYYSITTYEESVEDRIIREQTYLHLRGLIQLLPDEQKEVLLMRHYGKMSFRDIAEITEVSINTALGRMRYALNNLRKMLQTHELMLR